MTPEHDRAQQRATYYAKLAGGFEGILESILIDLRHAPIPEKRVEFLKKFIADALDYPEFEYQPPKEGGSDR